MQKNPIKPGQFIWYVLAGLHLSLTLFGLVYLLVYRLQHPKLTQTEIFIEFWPFITGVLIFGITLNFLASKYDK